MGLSRQPGQGIWLREATKACLGHSPCSDSESRRVGAYPSEGDGGEVINSWGEVEVMRGQREMAD